MTKISIHALREEGDAFQKLLLVFDCLFLSTPSARRATVLADVSITDFVISIHALREEGDGIPDVIREQIRNFYPRPPRGGRHITIISMQNFGNFYPRPPRGGRPTVSPVAVVAPAISIHALREEGDFAYAIPPPYAMGISIHALREEGDPECQKAAKVEAAFLSTPSARRAT